MKNVMIAALMAAGTMIGASAEEQVLVIKTAAPTDTVTYSIMMSGVNERKLNKESRRDVELLPGQTELVVKEGEYDGVPAQYFVYASQKGGRMSYVSNVYRKPGETITITVGENGATATGSALMDSITAAQASMEPYVAPLRSAETREAYEAAKSAYSSAATEYIRNHPNNPASIEMMTMADPMQLEVFDLITDAAKSQLNGEMYGVYYDSMKAQKARAEQALKVAPGKEAPDFSLPNAEGQMVSLSQFKGKYVMLDFWGSWCGWCIKGIPQMKEQYEKLKDKVEFISVACGDSKDAWTGALAKYEMPWVQVWANPETPKAEQVSTIYAVEGYPTKLVIDPEGKIVTKVAGEDPTFYDIFDELLK